MDKSYSRTIEGAVRFALWAQSLRSFPTVQQIVDHFDCSRASAYRYRHAYAAAQGFPTPPPRDFLRRRILRVKRLQVSTVAATRGTPVYLPET